MRNDRAGRRGEYVALVVAECRRSDQPKPKSGHAAILSTCQSLPGRRLHWRRRMVKVEQSKITPAPTTEHCEAILGQFSQVVQELEDEYVTAGVDLHGS